TAHVQDEAYAPPLWARHLDSPKRRCRLAMAPTPVHEWSPPMPDAVAALGIKWDVKRDDLTGFALSGNKVRKLEFLLSECRADGCDTVVTVGGVQSNHCRATAVAARQLGLEPHIILRRQKALPAAPAAATAPGGSDPGLAGNLLFDRLVGATLHLVDMSVYRREGANALGERVCAGLRAAGRRPYYIPVGGSNALGTWGYLEAADELRLQCAAAAA
ncbi:unnamed protein product, partial [Phaeothamnion confervicola]